MQVPSPRLIASEAFTVKQSVEQPMMKRRTRDGQSSVLARHTAPLPSLPVWESLDDGIIWNHLMNITAPTQRREFPDDFPLPCPGSSH